jgi:mono/diheme cytochrome c family protein
MTIQRTGLIAFFFAATTAVGAFAQSASDKRTHGAALFAESGCQHCHTIQNVGGSKGPDLSGVGRRLDENRIRKQIMEGGKQMPPFADILEKAETDDLIAYLRSCRQKEKK